MKGSVRKNQNNGLKLVAIKKKSGNNFGLNGINAAFQTVSSMHGLQMIFSKSQQAKPQPARKRTWVSPKHLVIICRQPRIQRLQLPAQHPKFFMHNAVRRV